MLRSAFTLIELLVVITIIVVLLALLTPALDQAIYQAELTVCGANMRAIGSGVTNYALDSRRKYPHRAGVHMRDEIWHPMRLSGAVRAPIDDRRLLKPYMSLDHALNCNLVTPVEIEDSDADAIVYSTYELWFGFQYRDDTTTYPGMLKLGDKMGAPRFTRDGLPANESTATGQATGVGAIHRYNLLASDRFSVQPGDSNVSGAHPDKEGIMAEVWFNNGQYPNAASQAVITAIGTAFFGGAKWTISNWSANSVEPNAHVTLDTNHVYGDLSVDRVVDVDWKENTRSGARVNGVPHYSYAGWATDDYTQIPRN